MDTEKQAAEVLLERGVSWPMKAPWYLRLLMKQKEISVKPLFLGTILEISLLYLKWGIKEEDFKDLNKLIAKYVKTVCSVQAIAVLNNRMLIRLFSRVLGKYFLRNCTPNMQLEMMIFIVAYSNGESFTNTIRLIGDLKITSPMNLSPKSRGSQQK